MRSEPPVARDCPRCGVRVRDRRERGSTRALYPLVERQRPEVRRRAGAGPLSRGAVRHPAECGNQVSRIWLPGSAAAVRAMCGFVSDGAATRAQDGRAAIARCSSAHPRQATRPAAGAAEARDGANGKGWMALRARAVRGGFGDDRRVLLPEREHGSTMPRRRDAGRITAEPPSAVPRFPLRRAFVAYPRHRAGRPDLPARAQASSARVSAARRGFVRRGPTGAPISWRRRLTIRGRAAINEWIPDDRAGARGFPRRASAAPVARTRHAARRTHADQCAAASIRVRGMAGLAFRVMNVTPLLTRSVPWRTRDGSHPVWASVRSARARSEADWRMPVRWRTVAG